MKTSMIALGVAATAVSAILSVDVSMDMSLGYPAAPYPTSTKEPTETSNKPYASTTVYATSVYTTSGQVTTDIISLYTTYCPVEDSTPVPTYPATISTSALQTISTVYSTETRTISKCHPDITDCPYTTAPMTTTKTHTSTYVLSPSTDVPTASESSSASSPESISSPVASSTSSGPLYPTGPSSAPTYPSGTGSVSPPISSSYSSGMLTVPVYPSGTGPAGNGPVGTGSSPPSSTGSPYPRSPDFTGAASSAKIGALLMMVGLIAALL